MDDVDRGQEAPEVAEAARKHRTRCLLMQVMGMCPAPGDPSAFLGPSFQLFLQFPHPGLGPLPSSLFGVGAGLLRLKVAQVFTALGVVEPEHLVFPAQAEPQRRAVSLEDAVRLDAHWRGWRRHESEEEELG